MRTDQRSLVNLDDQSLSTPWQQKAITKLLGVVVLSSVQERGRESGRQCIIEESNLARGRTGGSLDLCTELVDRGGCEL